MLTCADNCCLLPTLCNCSSELLQLVTFGGYSGKFLSGEIKKVRVFSATFAFSDGRSEFLGWDVSGRLFGDFLSTQIFLRGWTGNHNDCVPRTIIKIRVFDFHTF